MLKNNRNREIYENIFTKDTFLKGFNYNIYRLYNKYG